MGTVLLMRLNGDDAATVADETGLLGNLAPPAGTSQPTVVLAQLGNGLAFDPASSEMLAGVDNIPGSTLLARDCSIQFALAPSQPVTAGLLGTIYARGLGTGSSEYISAGIEVRQVNVPSHILEVRWFWQDVAGTLHTQLGGQFIAPTAGDVLITCTRLWLSTTSVRLRYFVGDVMVAEVLSADGDIGGGTTGTTQIGGRYTGAAFANFFDGVIDELRIADYEIAPAEVKQTHDRITVHQPNGYKLLLELHDPGFPISEDGASRVQRETRQWGMGLGYAAAQIENAKANLYPDTAYGPPLESWEGIMQRSPKLLDTLEQRQARVTSSLARLKDGASIPGISGALAELLDADPSLLVYMGFTPTTVDDFATLNTSRWRADPVPIWAASGSLVLTDANSNHTPEAHTWGTCMQAIGGRGRGAHIIVKLGSVTTPVNAEYGVAFGDWAKGNYILFGARWDGSTTFHLYHETFVAWTSTGAAVALGTQVHATLWLHLFAEDPLGTAFGNPTTTSYTCAVSSTSGSAGFATLATGIVCPWSSTDWALLYGRSISGTQNLAATFDDCVVRAPYGDRALRYYVYRDPSIPGSPDLLAAEATLRQLRQAHTEAHVITARVCLFDDPDSLFDQTPMGGI